MNRWKILQSINQTHQVNEWDELEKNEAWMAYKRNIKTKILRANLRNLAELRCCLRSHWRSIKPEGWRCARVQYGPFFACNQSTISITMYSLDFVHLPPLKWNTVLERVFPLHLILMPPFFAIFRSCADTGLVRLHLFAHYDNGLCLLNVHVLESTLHVQAVGCWCSFYIRFVFCPTFFSTAVAAFIHFFLLIASSAASICFVVLRIVSYAIQYEQQNMEYLFPPGAQYQ